MRLFVAVELDADVRAAAARAAEALQQQLRRIGLDARWVATENLHLTLVFIGQVGDVAAEPFASVMRRPFAMSPFRLRLGLCGVFPPKGRARVIWIGLAEGADALGSLQESVVGRLQPLGFEAERRPFSAHLTIARVKDVPRPAGRDVRAIVTAANVPDASCVVERVTLFRSHLSPKGSRYEVMAHGELAGSSA
jgi:RNA 2',3'-cyclic 3'-phosphodiesterase